MCVCVCVPASPGLSDLIHDNLTESQRTINLLQRMNIYQEVFLSVLYRLLPVQVRRHSAVSQSQQPLKALTVPLTPVSISERLTRRLTFLIILVPRVKALLNRNETLQQSVSVRQKLFRFT